MSHQQLAVATAAATLLRATPTLALRDVCRLLCLDRHTLERSCRKHFGMTFRSLRLQIRFAYASAALTRQPPISIKEVAAELGFANTQAFSRFIGKIAGTSPAQLRSKLLQQTGDAGTRVDDWIDKP